MNGRVRRKAAVQRSRFSGRNHAGRAGGIVDQGGFMFGNRRSSIAFWLGSLIVAIGVGLHLPMFVMARDMGYVLAGMPMDTGMIVGMTMIVGGIGLAGYGLLPKITPTKSRRGALATIAPPEDAPLNRAHWTLMAVLAVALTIDIMKPASLGFVTPGMRVEYGIGMATVSLLPFSALVGTVVGSFVWGALADLYGRRASILLSSVMFVGTSICGAMPSFWWNVFMCFLMGAAAGGMLPVANALLAETMPTKHRGWSLVLVGGIGAIGGYFAASGLSALLQPMFGWRIMWFLNMPTGLILIFLSPLLPESARFLQHMGRVDEARSILARFGAVTVASKEIDEDAGGHAPLPPPGYFGTTTALTLVALTWGFVNFGLLLWLPGELVAEGRSVALASSLIAKSTLIAAPTIVVAAYLYSAWSTKWSILTMIGITLLGLTVLLLRGTGSFPSLADPILPVMLLILGASGIISMLLPYVSENYPVRVRGRATGWVAGCSKVGGVVAQALSMTALVPAFGIAAAAIAVPSILSLLLIVKFGHETKGRDLRELEAAPQSVK
jgi:MFS transporter, putative metabolite:H+ symporter